MDSVGVVMDSVGVVTDGVGVGHGQCRFGYDGVSLAVFDLKGDRECESLVFAGRQSCCGR